MKTAISIPDDVFEAAEKLARALKIPRSRLYSQAVREYVARHSEDSITAALNAVVDEVGDDEELAFVRAASRSILERIEW